MPISDLLWGCPMCGEDRGIRNDRQRCRACGTRYLRDPGAMIRAVAPDGAETVRSVPDWLQRLPEPASLLENDPIRTARVSIRTARDEAKVFGAGGYLNRVEVFGGETAGTLRLEADRLTVRRDEEDRESGGEREREGEREQEAGGEWEIWPLESLTAVQTSSKSLQLKRRGAPLVGFRFRNDAVFLWEQLLRAALRDFYGRTGRGEIREFQPRIATR